MPSPPATPQLPAEPLPQSRRNHMRKIADAASTLPGLAKEMLRHRHAYRCRFNVAWSRSSRDAQSSAYLLLGRPMAKVRPAMPATIIRALSPPIM